MPTVFLIGFTIMSLASIAIYALGGKGPSVVSHTLLHASVPFIAATAYLAMAFGIGTVVGFDGTTTFVARYLDWSATTPILLAGLVMTALHGRRTPDGTGGYLVAIIVLDVLMIVTGLIASLGTVPVGKLIWFLWSCAAFLGVLYLLWVPLRSASRMRGGPLDLAYNRNLLFLTVVWFLYPVVFAIGPEGLKLIPLATSVWSILVLDVIAKVLYAFYAAKNLDTATDRTEDGMRYETA